MLPAAIGELAEALGVAEGTPMSALVKALQSREMAREVGSMVRGVEDFLAPCQGGAKRSKQTGKCPEEETQDDQNASS
jgi:hypothetical protein